MYPPFACTVSDISLPVRRDVPLNSMCSRKFDSPAPRFAASWMLPVLTHTWTDKRWADRSGFTSSVSPFGRTVRSTGSRHNAFSRTRSACGVLEMGISMLPSGGTERLGCRGTPGASSFKLVEGLNKPSSYLFNSNGVLFAGTNWGVGIIENDHINKMLINNSTNILVNSSFFKDRIYVGHRDGVTILQKNKNHYDTYLTELHEEISNIVEDEDSSLWAQTLNGVIIHSTNSLQNLIPGQNFILDLKYFNKNNGLPGNEWNIFNVHGKMVLSTDKGTYK